jgi:hypothetical protein
VIPVNEAITSILVPTIFEGTPKLQAMNNSANDDDATAPEQEIMRNIFHSLETTAVVGLVVDEMRRIGPSINRSMIDGHTVHSTVHRS